jgi:hypothetical protein
MMKTLIVAFALLMACMTAHGQTHKTKVVGKESDSNPVVSVLKAKLAGTQRYELTEKDVEVELYIDVQCARLNTGLACDATYFYYPPELGLTRLWLGASLHTGSDPTSIAQGMFEFFVNDSSEANWQRRKPTTSSTFVTPAPCMAQITMRSNRTRLSQLAWVGPLSRDDEAQRSGHLRRVKNHSGFLDSGF